MNEKELLKKVSDKEFGSRGASLSAEEVLGTSVSGRARARTAGWRIGLAVAAAAAVAIGAAVFLNRSEVPKSSENIPQSQAESVTADESIAPAESIAEGKQGSSEDKAYYLHIIDMMREHPENYITYIHDALYEKSTWTKNGEEKQGVFRETTQRSYENIHDGTAEIDPTPVIEFVKLLDAQNGEWTAKHQDLIVYDLVPEMQDQGVYFETKPHGEIGDNDVRILFSVSEYSYDLYSITVRFTKLNGDPLDVNTLHFFAERNDPAFDMGGSVKNVGGIIWDRCTEETSVLPVLTPFLPVSFRTDKIDTIYAGSISDINTLSLHYGRSRTEQKAKIDIAVDHENNKLIIDTAVTDSTETDGEISLKGAVFVPQTEDPQVPEIVSYVRDGVELALDDPLIHDLSEYRLPDVTETFTEAAPVKHHYEITYAGDLSGLKMITIANVYDTVVPYWDDGLSKHYGGGIIIRFEDDPYAACPDG